MNKLDSKDPGMAQLVFISVDPKRDTPEVLKKFAERIEFYYLTFCIDSFFLDSVLSKSSVFDWIYARNCPGRKEFPGLF
jgi:cytochrome oxidase Cu insertion factor (SCO1/SenC/PrrC family)